MTIKALIFDTCGVLFLPKGQKNEKNIMSSYEEFCKLLPGVKISGKDFFEKSRDIYYASTRGEIPKNQVLENLSEILQIAPEEVEKLITKTLRANTSENTFLLKEISRIKKKGYKTGILSIQWHLYTDFLNPKKFNKLFNESVISCFDKIRKPLPESYYLILKKLDVEPGEALFVDDKQENLDAAEKLGMHTLIFKNNTQFFSDLEKLGIK